MPTQNFEARPTLEKDGTVSWTLCHMNPDPDECGSTKDAYPDVFLPKGSKKHNFEFKITNDATGLGLKFANDPLWIKRGSQPTGPVIDSQIESVSGKATETLKFVDKNSKPDMFNPSPVELHYQLNFVDKNNKKVTELDPEITNGGTNFIGDNQTAVLLAGIALLLLMGAIWFSITAIRRNRVRSAPPQDSNRATAGQRDDVNTTGGGEL